MKISDGVRLKGDDWNGFEPNKEYVAIGWLGDRSFETGDVPNTLITVLSGLAVSNRRNVSRGFYRCRFCSEASITIDGGGQRYQLGSAELWVAGVHPIVYVAPNMVIHYIRDHGYRPPQEFIDAVLQVRNSADNGA